jgi:hypothetical protein
VDVGFLQVGVGGGGIWNFAGALGIGPVGGLRGR